MAKSGAGMTRGDWIVEVDRVVVTGAPAAQFDAVDIRALVTDQLARSMADPALPDRSGMRATVHIDRAISPSTANGVASAIATAVTSAVNGGGGHG